ncbi:MAG: lipid-A-disaccharide synthase [Myxococcota bacterium]|nr:lipid-A-disaccharide synthase [Myxococcota bacterium]
MTGVLISAGDASGEAHAADLVRALRARRPGLSGFGLGGDAMRAAGVELLVEQRELAVAGLVEVLGTVRRVFDAWRRLAAAARERRPALAILVDAPEFNLPLARRLQRQGVPILYYISPQVWAWRTGRVRKLARRVDRMAVIFPFEVDVYAGTGLRVEFVGHPLVERMREVREKHDRADARASLGIAGERELVVLLPGSRRNEIQTGLGVQLEAARALHARRPDTAFVLALAPSLHPDAVRAGIRAAALPPQLALQVVEGRTHEAVVAADVALAKPGTATLEVALLGCPLVVVGRAHPLTAAVMRRLVRVPSFAMPNLIAGAPIVPEFLQGDAVPDRVAAALADLVRGPARELQLARLAEVAQRLGTGGAAARTASMALEMIDERTSSA